MGAYIGGGAYYRTYFFVILVFKSTTTPRRCVDLISIIQISLELSSLALSVRKVVINFLLFILCGV